MTDNQKTANERKTEEAKTEAQEKREAVVATKRSSDIAAKVEVPRVEDVKAEKPLTTPANINTVNPVANVDSVDPSTGYDPNIPNTPATFDAERAATREAANEEDENVVDISGMNKAEILLALYNGAAPHGYGMFQATHDWTQEDADLFMERAEAGAGSRNGFGMGRLMFGDIFGRRINADLSGDWLDLNRYDAAHGKGAGRKALGK